MVKLILIGLGQISDVWINTVLNSPEAELVGLVEVDPQAAKAKIAEFDLDPKLVFSSFRGALNAVVPDGVINVTPPAVHAEISIMALEAGIPVLSEKPLADTWKGSQSIVRRSNETGVLHMVAQNYRYKDSIQTLKRVISSNSLGRMGSISVDFHKAIHRHGFHQELDFPLLIDMSIHHFDLLRFFLEKEPETTYALGWNPPWGWFNGQASATVLFEFPANITVNYSASWVSTGAETAWSGDWRFDFENGVVSLKDDQVYIHQGEDSTWRGLNSSKMYRIELVRMPKLGQSYLLDEFLAAITKGTLPKTTCQDNIHSMRMVFDTIESIESGAPVRKPGE